MIAELQRRTADYFEDAEHTAMDYLVAWIERGRTLTALAQSLTESIYGEPKDGSPEVTRHMLDRYAREIVGDDRAAALLSTARKTGAHGIIEDGIQTLDDGSDDRDTVNANNVRLAARERLAAAWNREDFAKAGGTNVLISFAGLHLEALRQRSITATATIAPEAEDAELVEDSDQMPILPA